MKNIESCTFINANFFYVTDNTWKHAPRAVSSPNNLILVTEGKLYIEVHGQKYSVSSGNFIYLPHGCESVGYRPSEPHTAFYCIMFKSNSEFSLPTHFTVQSISPVRDIYAQIIQKASQPNYPKEALDALLRCLFYEIEYQISVAVTENNTTLPLALKRYIEASIFRNITVNECAKHFGISANHLNRVFSQSEHINIKAYINQLKIKRIEEYLVSTNTPLSVIAKKLSFPSAASLCKFYTYHTGRTISEYRAKFIN